MILLLSPTHCGGELGGYILYFIILGGWRGQDLWGGHF